VLSAIRGRLYDLPSPTTLSGWWNFGSLLGLCLLVQLLTGLFLAMHYVRDLLVAFDSVRHIVRDVNYGWAIRIIHANGARAFFVCLYLHVGRGLYYGSFRLKPTWAVGSALLLLVIASAFLGYVLPWGQMSFWGATVITNLFSAVPIIGPDIVGWLWGGFAVDQATLTRFFAFHFIVPFLAAGLVGVHLVYLHETGSSNPLGLPVSWDKVPFYPYFARKDLFGALSLIILLISIVILIPWSLGDPENFTPANPLVTPVHIQPEWYFLFAYAILRSIPNKLGGVIALGASVLVLFYMPFSGNARLVGAQFYPVRQSMFWGLVGVFGLLTWVGACPVESPYIILGQVFSVLYFMYFFQVSFICLLWDSLILKGDPISSA